MDEFSFSQEQVQEQEQEHEEEAEQDHEQEVEQEEEHDKVQEAPLEQRYARESEEAVPWPLKALTQLRSSELPFYPMADFAVNKGIFNESSPAPCGIPSFVMLSDNYYRRQWRLTSVRRLRSVICFMEWVPSVEKLARFEVSTSTLSEDQRFRLREALELCSGGRSDCSAGFGEQEVRALCNVLDLQMEGAAFTAAMPPCSRVSMAELEKQLATQSIYKMQQGRLFVALSLQEAEHLRGSMHLLKSRSPDCGIALRCVGCKEARDESLLDWHGPVLRTELGHQLEVAEQLFRFLNSVEDFQAREVSVLLRALQLTRMEDRLPWWLDTRGCRRRSHRPWQRMPVAKVFLQQDEYEDWATKALLLRLRWALAAQQLWPADAFRLWDSQGNGCLQRADLAAGLDHFGVRSERLSSERWAQQVENLFRCLAQDGREAIFVEDFRAALELQAGDWEVTPMASMASPSSRVSRAASAFEGRKHQAAGPADGVPPSVSPLRAGAAPEAISAEVGASPMGAVSASPSVDTLKPRVSRLTPEICQQLKAGRFKLKWQKHSSFRPLWSGAVCCWAATELIPRGKFLGVKRGSNAVKERIALGHYVSTSNLTAAQLMEVTDEQHSGFFAKHPRDDLNRFLDTFFPHPIRFRHIWQHKEASKTLYVWQAVPPSADFVAAGMVCTTEDEAPSLEELRCLPRLWAERVVDLQAWPCSDGFSIWLPSDGVGFLQVTGSEAPETYQLRAGK
ncbi:unnamed protein product, partial [Effrenium voratum]